MGTWQDAISNVVTWIPSALNKDRSKSNGNVDTHTPDETSRLLPHAIDGEAGYEIEDGKDRNEWQLILHEFWVLLRGSIPVILAYALQNSLQTISVLIVGRLSPEALATAAFAYMFAMATGWLIALGGTTAIDTLASASFTGSKNPHDLGIILQRAFVVLFIFYIPVAVIWGFAEPIFNALGQEAYLARDAARFLAILVPGGIGYIYFEALKKFLQAQGILHANFVYVEPNQQHRNNAAWHIRATDHFAGQCWSQLLVCLHIQVWAVRRTNCYWYQLLAELPLSSCLRPLR